MENIYLLISLPFSSSGCGEVARRPGKDVTESCTTHDTDNTCIKLCILMVDRRERRQNDNDHIFHRYSQSIPKMSSRRRSQLARTNHCRLPVSALAPLTAIAMSSSVAKPYMLLIVITSLEVCSILDCTGAGPVVQDKTIKQILI